MLFFSYSSCKESLVECGRSWFVDSDLAISEIDLEECFTLLESQREDAFNSRDEGKARELVSIEFIFMFKSLLSEVLSEFQVFSARSL